MKTPNATISSPRPTTRRRRGPRSDASEGDDVESAVLPRLPTLTGTTLLLRAGALLLGAGALGVLAWLVGRVAVSTALALRGSATVTVRF